MYTNRLYKLVQHVVEGPLIREHCIPCILAYNQHLVLGENLGPLLAVPEDQVLLAPHNTLRSNRQAVARGVCVCGDH